MILRSERKRLQEKNKGNLALIGSGLLAIAIVGFYLYATVIRSTTEGITKTIFLSVYNDTKGDTLAPITVKLNGHEIFSETVSGEIFKSVDFKLIEGENKLELVAHGRLVLQDTLKIDWPKMYELSVYYFDTAGQQGFNYRIEEFFFE